MGHFLSSWIRNKIFLNLALKYVTKADLVEQTQALSLNLQPQISIMFWLCLNKSGGCDATLFKLVIFYKFGKMLQLDGVL